MNGGGNFLILRKFYQFCFPRKQIYWSSNKFNIHILVAENLAIVEFSIVNFWTKILEDNLMATVWV